ncbi:RNA polymerase sigma-70 factor [Bacteroides sp. 519]|uniref:RNA polymerase sigma-70 factor n=1 Tax=Bacteroides sp. 519 TaxID=2302937 RepID=UPI0013D2DC2F|nr:RNA polymerase sigma-70 factor [Bacteroides sp. 519]NDV57223.1 RNA polymerase sigma-70 factor [Bacteroides sp. 519]
MLNDISVLKKIKEGNINAYEHVFKLYYSGLMIYAFGIIGRKDIAEEIVQDVFYKIWKERENIQILHSIKSYLYGAVRNQSLQYCEHQEVKERYKQKVLLANVEAHEDNPEEQFLIKELEEIINKTLKQLPPRRQQIFKLHRFEGKKYKEIADELSLSVKTIEAEMTKTYQALRKEIEKYI